MIPHNRAVLTDKDGRPTRDWYDWFRRLAEVFEPIGGSTGLSGKQDKLVSGGNLRTVNGESLLGYEDLVIDTTLTSTSATLSGTVTLSVTGTWYDGPSVTLTAGTWAINACVSFSRTTATATTWEARLYDGTNDLASANTTTPSTANFTTSASMCALVTVTGSTTVKLQATTNAGAAACLMRNTTFVKGAANATQITAVRIA